MVGKVTAGESLLVVIVVPAPVVLYIASWVVLAAGKPYSRARPLGFRLLKTGFAITSIELLVQVAWGIGSPASFPVIFARVMLGLMMLTIPAALIWLYIDTRRGGPPVSPGNGRAR